MRQILRLLLFAGLVAAPACAQTNTSLPWPRPVPCRIQDGDNPEVFIMTLGDVNTSLATGVFDPIRDEVRLNDGSTKSNYYRDTLGVKYYQPLDKSRFQLPPSGWCTWYYYYSRINETEVKRNTDWIAANLKDYGAQYVQIDDGWQGSGAAGSRARDWSTVNLQQFPGGMAALATHIKSAGLTPAIWLAPHGQSNRQVITNNPKVFLFRPDGASPTNTWEGPYLVDPSTPESQTYLHDLFTRLVGWGYDYFKIDGQPIVVEQYGLQKQFMKNPSDDAAALYRKTVDTIRSAIGPNRYLLGCWGTPIEGAGIMNGSRTGGDIVLGWGGFQVALRATLQGYYLHNIVWYSDPDVLIVRSPLTLDQARVWAAVYGLTGQAMLDSDRLMDLSDERVELLKRVYPAVDIRPLDLFPTERYKRIWDLKVNHLGRNYDVVGVFNFNEHRAEQTFLKWQDLGLPTNKLIHVFDFWNKEYLGAWAGGMMVEAAPTSCRLLTLVPSDDKIQLISTSRHVSQGWVDLVALNATGTGLDFKGTSKVVKNDPYELRFAFPRGTNFVVKTATASGASGNLPVRMSNHQGWAAVELVSPENGAVTWEVKFEPADYYHYPIAAPEGVVFAERVGLDGVNLRWREQYYLNVGYQVYINGRLAGYTPENSFSLRGLEVQSNYTAEVRTVWEDGRESAAARNSQVRFTLAALAPEELLLTQLEPARSNAGWRGFENDERLSGAPLSVGGKRYEHGLAAFGNTELEFDLKGLYDKFSAQAGLDENSGNDHGLEFFVIGDGKELWHSNGALKKADAPAQITVGTSGVHRLVLRTTGAGGRRNPDQADWIEPRVTRKAADH